MKPDEKVMSEWHPSLRDGAQPLEPLPQDKQTDYMIIRVQGENPRTALAAISDFLQREHLSGENRVSFTTVHQKDSRWQPRNSWPAVRGVFDWLMSFGRDVMKVDERVVADKKAARDRRRLARSAR